MSPSSELTITSTLPLPNSSEKIPLLGFGVYDSPQHVCEQSCLTAFDAGYRHIDTAQYYANETEVGHAMRASKIPRSELYITTKILQPCATPEATYASIVDSVTKIDGADGYVDLFLIHTPNFGANAIRTMWQALERAHKEGKAKAIGVSNFGIGQITAMKAYASVYPPAVNQIELHPWCQQREVVRFCEEQGVVVEAYCPLVRGQKAKDETLVGVAEKVGKSMGQVLIRYSLQKGWVPLPKSDNPGRIKENADVYGWELDEEDMRKLDGCDQGPAGALVEAVRN